MQVSSVQFSSCSVNKRSAWPWYFDPKTTNFFQPSPRVIQFFKNPNANFKPEVAPAALAQRTRLSQEQTSRCYILTVWNNAGWNCLRSYEIFSHVRFWTLTFEVRTWRKGGDSDSACQISRSKIILFESRRRHTHEHKRPTNCSTRPLNLSVTDTRCLARATQLRATIDRAGWRRP